MTICFRGGGRLGDLPWSCFEQLSPGSTLNSMFVWHSLGADGDLGGLIFLPQAIPGSALV